MLGIRANSAHLRRPEDELHPPLRIGLREEIGNIICPHLKKS